MSIGRKIAERIYVKLVRRARSLEPFGARVIANIKTVRGTIFYVGVAYCAGQLFQYHVIEHSFSSGVSMFPTMAEKTPLVLTSRLHGHGKNMMPGDIVSFASPIFRGQAAGKRIIGLAGDFVVRDPAYAPSVGGAPVPGITDWRSQAETKDGVELREREEPMMVEVPEGHMYVVGDNLGWSRDSRFYGAVPMALIIGKQLVHGNAFSNWNWTTRDQMRRIPKEEEEEYLARWAHKQKQSDDERVVVRMTNADVTERLD